ncbi:MAG: TIGR04348 family glycosyltransferase [Rubrivivax sp.]|nr:TIGR04348 family glycosyltransferase [Rubrivivax sp.]
MQGKVQIVIVTPALADANNGNWRTARRWAGMLAPAYRVRVVRHWHAAEPAAAADRLMIALHARRSAPSVAAWREARPDAAPAPLVLALTGTDLYRDIDVDADAQRSLTLADRLIVLNELGPQRLPPEVRRRCDVVLQSCTARRPRRDKPRRFLRALMVGHLRPEKDPGTAWRALELLRHRTDLRFDHVGEALDPALRRAACAQAAAWPAYRWLGGRAHGDVRRRIQAAHVLVHPSVMEGGAQVVIEAIRSGTPVLASRVDGNVGLLGADYGGYFDVGDPAALAALLQRARDDPAMLPALSRQVARRAPLFAPRAEAAALRRIVRALLTHRRPAAAPAHPGDPR